MPEAQGNRKFVTELDIRIWMRDADPEANLLLDDFEFTPEEIRTAMTLVVDKWNDTPPMIGTFTVNNFPFRSGMIQGAAANLLFIAANRYRRNDLSYNVPGGAVNDQDKWKSYDAAGERLSQAFTKWLKHTKRAINMEQGWATTGGIPGHCYYGRR